MLPTFDPPRAGPPDRQSADLDFDESSTFEGVIKVRLGHSVVGSVLVPDHLFVNLGGWRFFQASFFGAPLFRFNIDDGLHDVRFNLDVGAPRARNAARLIAHFRSDALQHRFKDGGQLYRCTFQGPSHLLRHAAGRARPLPDGDFALTLFHITNAQASLSIRRSGEIWTSPWNLQGTRKLENVAYVYLTTLPSIRDEEDLRRIAMASNGKIGFQTTSTRPVEDVLEMIVYRENTAGRTIPLPVTIPSAYVAPPHLLLHPPIAGPAYYEIVGPEIFRVGLNPGTNLTYNGSTGLADENHLKAFRYIVLGDASEIDGLAAPYDEEDTRQIMHIENLTGDQDVFGFWLSHQNSDQMTGRVFERRELGC